MHGPIQSHKTVPLICPHIFLTRGCLNSGPLPAPRFWFFAHFSCDELPYRYTNFCTWSEEIRGFKRKWRIFRSIILSQIFSSPLIGLPKPMKMYILWMLIHLAQASCCLQSCPARAKPSAWPRAGYALWHYRSPIHNKDLRKRVWCDPNFYCNKVIIVRQ